MNLDFELRNGKKSHEIKRRFAPGTKIGVFSIVLAGLVLRPTANRKPTATRLCEAEDVKHIGSHALQYKTLVLIAVVYSAADAGGCSNGDWSRESVRARSREMCAANAISGVPNSDGIALLTMLMLSPLPFSVYKVRWWQ